ncbi:hypothetical protein Ct9H90mP29_07470 [bacterium]|nr:MAG: hypothetical protein Ct9H90mP29_07470 [bacterium]
MDMVFLRVGKSHTFYELSFQEEDQNMYRSEQGLSFGAGVKYQIPEGLCQYRLVFTDFGIFNNIEGYSISFTF